MITANISVEDCKSTRRASHYQFQSGGTNGSADQPAGCRAIDPLAWRDMCLNSRKGVFF
jgi:hypothetical protein